MNEEYIEDLKEIKDLLNWFLMILFIIIGIMNLVLIHPVPGFFYVVVSLFYCPPIVAIAKHRLGFSIPYLIKLIAAFVILWGTLAVGDLAEMYGL